MKLLPIFATSLLVRMAGKFENRSYRLFLPFIAESIDSLQCQGISTITFCWHLWAQLPPWHFAFPDKDRLYYGRITMKATQLSRALRHLKTSFWPIDGKTERFRASNFKYPSWVDVWELIITEYKGYFVLSAEILFSRCFVRKIQKLENNIPLPRHKCQDN